MVEMQDRPTEKQLAAIRRLASVTKSSVNLSKIASKREASKLIERLIAKRNGGAERHSWEVKDRKCAYGLATKLVFKRYLQIGRDYMGAKERFWKEVDELYTEYVEHISRATCPASGMA